jgi:hypothetical protein
MYAETTVRREYRKVEKLRKKCTNEAGDKYLFGSYQTLAWVLGENAMKPSRCFKPAKEPNEKKPH